MNVLSLFDGIACGRIALQRTGIEVENYYASEVDKHAIEVAKSNWPEIQHIGDVRNLTYFNGRLWRGRWDDYLQSVVLTIDEAELIHDGHIDLVIGGSPCQGFSNSGKLKGFEDPRSKLFWHYVRLWRQIRAENPKAKFLLENVKMKKEWVKVITEALGVEPIEINSALVSAQNRKRLYWTNIEGVEQPEDKGIVLRDITEDGRTALGIAQRGRYNKSGVIEQRFECNKTEKSNALTTVQKDSLLFVPVDSHESSVGLKCIGGLMKESHTMWLNDGKILQRNFRQGNRVYSENGKAASLNANSGGLGRQTGLYEIDGVIRRLTRLECERLQTVPDNYLSGISDSKAIKALGNGWTVDVIAHILKYLKP